MQTADIFTDASSGDSLPSYEESTRASEPKPALDEAATLQAFYTFKLEQCLAKQRQYNENQLELQEEKLKELQEEIKEWELKLQHMRSC
ncbi:uncharacterized protein SPPG_04511 [Spizellomyces punctatus DAOM BR117]|uniref:Uncharacterized protein n=1 Tax=Spizellomyces punctatus (strain DAOM BR117) TaxID=645134 RepID=A0A0L0HH16_SPIPD|nr:uncharacterized protein SPPG_04511 [Spizellomyces punctatus DAOM BR117]KND00170.1 hypothetical protein SPPG_04511 [Spizellomyces punctatus DAOM BR117]|eukprot:XP_016608209.1 hypothetical protein SPPG_04511 [Spizellomyces punctatus DAOM BR117]